MNNNRTSWFLISPGLSWLVVFMIVPCLIVFSHSFFERGVYGGIDYLFTLENFSRTSEEIYLRVFLNSARIAGLATLIAVVIAYPAAYAISLAPVRRQNVYLFLIMLPFWSNYLIRTYAWMVLLNREGVINKGLTSVGVIDEPINMLYNEFAVIIGLIYNYMPFVILAIYASLQRLDRHVLEASQDLGAPAWRTFIRITLPLTVPGVAAGAVFVFVLSIGNFITPDLLGGGQIQMVGNLIYDQFLSARDWPFGAALSLALIFVMMLLLFVQAVIVNLTARNDAQSSRDGADGAVPSRR